jgi:peptidoglycan/LPS O-acetylase OafA/YrhL
MHHRLQSLDGYRGLAVSAVIISHIFFVKDNFVSKLFSGSWGVTLFFVISGFLITTLLLREKSITGRVSVRNFYIRRVLRIFPVAYFFLIILFLINTPLELSIGSKEFISAAIYTKNLPIPGTYDSWHLGHFWSLSVEEQYYIWAPIVLLAGMRRFVTVALITILCAHITTYLYFSHFHDSSLLLYTHKLLLPQVPILIGSLGAILLFERPKLKPIIGSTGCLGLLIISMIFSAGLITIIPDLLRSLLTSIALIILISASTGSQKNLFISAINSPLPTRIGVYSYSLYIWQQLFTFKTLITLPQRWNQELTIFINLIALIAVTLISYHVLELPFIKLRKHFILDAQNKPLLELRDQLASKNS